jgi:hypothetical protein
MTVKVLALLVLLALVPTTNAVASDDGSVTMTRHYVGGEVGPLLGLMPCSELGRVCFGRSPSGLVEITIEDQSGLPVGGILQVDGGSGRPFCGSTGRIPVQPGGFVSVSLDSVGDVRGAHWHNGPGCSGGTGASRGRVVATFRSGE